MRFFHFILEYGFSAICVFYYEAYFVQLQPSKLIFELFEFDDKFLPIKIVYSTDKNFSHI